MIDWGLYNLLAQAVVNHLRKETTYLWKESLTASRTQLGLLILSRIISYAAEIAFCFSRIGLTQNAAPSRQPVAAFWGGYPLGAKPEGCVSLRETGAISV